ncbi:helix-turn-helix domain-containing protein [Flavobacterium psychrophilum]|uniref:helix-turn-helix domain-containing protein n=1 Tax=Flavobacterium psychrophilum TaxID=96345 RepID=UPI00090CC9EA|nr:helix-turn-helix domain-containing protein [Flavobacterium psychrophilum]EKT2072636.1 helix-turn-helix domain-containing protein [Flavobacterium psychrophilum]EKT4492149.1 helix-turn-helix domain-containing protein [Flavobacterium psychrophilum]SHH92638.1 Probable transcriptional regulator, AraC family [Flavobacterium psychrophilum]
MDSPHNQERIVTMHQMLFEMAGGNFNSQIPLSSYDDELETLVVLINMVAEEMKESIFHDGYVNTHSTQQFITQTTFILDDAFFIQSFSPEVTCFLGYSELELIDKSLYSIITELSINQVQKVLDGSISLPTIIPLDFTTKDNLLVSVSCSIGKLINRSEIILSLITPVRKDFYNPMSYVSENDKQIKTRKVDAFLIQKLYDYILAHLEEPLPSLKELSREFGTNEHKLKDGFRHFFKTSIYQFYNDERLKRAYYMIEHTALPLKNISVMNGFINYPNFSKSFKKHFGCSPYEVHRTETDFTFITEE